MERRAEITEPPGPAPPMDAARRQESQSPGMVEGAQERPTGCPRGEPRKDVPESRREDMAPRTLFRGGSSRDAEPGFSTRPAQGRSQDSRSSGNGRRVRSGSSRCNECENLRPQPLVRPRGIATDGDFPQIEPQDRRPGSYGDGAPPGSPAPTSRIPCDRPHPAAKKNRSQGQPPFPSKNHRRTAEISLSPEKSETPQPGKPPPPPDSPSRTKPAPTPTFTSQHPSSISARLEYNDRLYCRLTYGVIGVGVVG